MNPTEAIECKFFKKTPWWKCFKDWHDCTHPRKTITELLENGICIFAEYQSSCPDFTPKDNKNKKR